MQRKFLTETPRVLLLIPTAAKSNRDKLAGIFQYVQLHTPWNMQIVDRACDAQTLANIRNWRPCGMIIGRTPDESDGIRHLRIPTVIMDAPSARYAARFKKAWFLTCDSEAIAAVAADYLINKRFSHFAYVCDSQASEWAVQRSRFFRTRLAKAGLACSVFTPRQEPGGRAEKDWARAQSRLADWLLALPKQTALFAANDLLAREILGLCQLAEIRVPSDLAVLGCDNDELLCENTTPPLSSVEPDFEACGYQAAQLLEQLMFRSQGSPRHILYGARRIVERESSQFRPLALDARVYAGLDFIRLNAARTIGVADIARHMRVSRRMAELLFRKHLNQSIGEEIQLARIERLKRLLADTNRPITLLCGLCGYQSEAHAKRLFKRVVGLTMSGYRRKVKSGGGG